MIWLQKVHYLNTKTFTYINIQQDKQEICLTTSQDCKSYRGANIFSNNKLVVSKIKLNLKRTCHDKKSEIDKQFDSLKLKYPVIKNKFFLKLKNRFHSLENLNGFIKENFQITAKAILRHEKPEKKDLISEKTQNKIEERKKVKNKIYNV